jgi:hypothetical protein
VSKRKNDIAVPGSRAIGDDGPHTKIAVAEATAIFRLRNRARDSVASLTDDTNALGERSTLTRGDVELDALTLEQGATSLSLNFAEVDENVSLTIAGDEAEALFVVKPLYGANCHCS